MRASYGNLALADDDHAVRKSLAFLLALTGNQVVDYASADEFPQRGDLNRVSGLILDHHMAHVTGLELAARLRAGGGSWPFCWSPVRHRLPLPPGPLSLALRRCWKNHPPRQTSWPLSMGLVAEL